MKKVREKYVTNPYFDPNLVKKVKSIFITKLIVSLPKFFKRT